MSSTRKYMETSPLLITKTQTALSSLVNCCFCPVLSAGHPESGLLKSFSGALTEIIKKFFMNLLNILKCFNLGGSLFRLTLADNRNLYAEDWGNYKVRLYL